MESQPLNSERPKNPFYCVFHSLVAFLSNLNPCQLSSLRLSFNLDNECSQEAICPIFTSLTLFRHINTISSPPLLYNHCPEKKTLPSATPPTPLPSSSSSLPHPPLQCSGCSFVLGFCCILSEPRCLSKRQHPLSLGASMVFFGALPENIPGAPWCACPALSFSG